MVNNILTNGLQKLLSQSVNHVIGTETWAVARLRPFSGALVCIKGLPIEITLEINEHGLFIPCDSSATPDVTFLLPPDTFAKLLISPASIASSVKISGSVDLAENLAFVFRNSRWDIEADLAKIMGDIPAYRLARFGSSLFSQAMLGIERTKSNLAEYLREESSLLVTPHEIDQFGYAVDELRDGTARFEQRLKSL